MEYIQLIAGLLLLLFSADYLVKGGVGLASKLNISPLVIGMTVIAFGTSAPELIVSTNAAISGHPEIALGNVIGSNIANIGLILGITALILPIPVSKASIKNDGPVMVLASILFILAAYDGIITRWEGLFGFALLVGYTIYMIHKSRKENNANGGDDIDEDAAHLPVWKAFVFIIGACVGLAFGADLLVKGATTVATSFGVSQKVIGVTVVAFGTSLPELAASVVAALKKQTDISIGNIIGSNLFNILSVIGLSSAIHPIGLNFADFKPDFIWMLMFSILILVLIYPINKNISIFKSSNQNKLKALTNFDGGILGRISGLILIGLYIFYIYRLF